MKFVTCKLSAPKVGRTGEDALQLTVRQAETWQDCVELASGDEEGALALFHSAYVVKLQTLRGDLKHDGSTDEAVLKAAETFVYEHGKRGGGLSRAAAERKVIARARAEGKSTISLDELDAAVEEELAAAALEAETETE